MLTVSTTGMCTAMILTTSSTYSSHQNVSTSNHMQPNAQQHGKPTAECELNSSGTGSSSAFDGSIGGKEMVSQLVYYGWVVLE